jgi:hypothetical protein
MLKADLTRYRFGVAQRYFSRPQTRETGRLAPILPFDKAAHRLSSLWYCSLLLQLLVNYTTLALDHSTHRSISSVYSEGYNNIALLPTSAVVAVGDAEAPPRTDPGVRFSRTRLFGNPRFRTRPAQTSTICRCRLCVIQDASRGNRFSKALYFSQVIRLF